MKIIIVGRKCSVSDSFKQRIEKKLSKFERLFDADAEANVTITVEKNRQIVEVTIKTNYMLFRAEQSAMEMETALDNVIDALGRQIRKNKTKLQKKMHEGAFKNFAYENFEEEKEFNIVKSKKFSVKPLDIEEAILQMNLLGHEFFMFRNANTNEVNVVYKRKDGNYGVLEPEE